MKKLFILLFVFSKITSFTSAQVSQNELNPKLLDNVWPAFWIAPPQASLKDFGVFHFRKSFDLDEKPSKFIIHVSADNRYRLFVNGKSIGVGPARGDLHNWNYETYDIAEVLQKGNNKISAVVWNFGKFIPWAQITQKTALIIQGNSDAEKIINTNKSWRVDQNQAYSPIDDTKGLNSFIVVGCGEEVNGAKYPWGWQNNEYNDSFWPLALELERGYPRGVGTGADWYLVPRTIPLLEEKAERIPKIVRIEGENISDQFLKGKSVVIKPNSKIKLLLDQTYLTNAYLQLNVSDGNGSKIKLTYAEALFDANNQKGNRNEIIGKTIKGQYDIFHLSGGQNRVYSPLWFRTYRYIQMEIETSNNPLIINDLYGVFTGYPFQEKAMFASNDTSLQDIWQVGWRTARLCAVETYFDCPYYEQLQYVGDTRIQALISLYVSGDDRLMRKAIDDFNKSRTYEGLTQSRYPSSVQQIIPPFSLFWTNMVYDYFMHRPDDAFIKSQLQGVKNVLYWYEQHLDNQQNMLGAMEWWNFVDWAKEWPWQNEKSIGGEPGGTYDKGHSSIITFQFAYSLNLAAQLFEYYGDTQQASHYKQLGQKIAQSAFQQCFDKIKGVIGDTPDKKHFSQHAIIMAILADAVPQNQVKALIDKLLNDKSLTQATFYFRFYLTQALKKVEMNDLYYANLSPWRDMLKIGLTTFAENPEPTRSDCHAWSSSPNYDFLATICGIMPDQAGFKKVLIRPALGELQNIQGQMPHYQGDIVVSLQRKGKTGIVGEVNLPNSLSGRFVWNGKEIALQAGKNKINLDN